MNEHLGGSGPNGDPATAMYDIWGYVCLKYGLRSIIDVGCALGFNARWLLDLGYDVIGVEGFPEYIAGNKLPRERVFQIDYSKQGWAPGREFDLALCTEFVEHVEARFVQNFIETFKKCRYVLMTHALPGQGGHHHVNEQPASYWIAHLDAAGFDHLADESALLQSTHTGKYHYGRNTLLLFRRR